MTILWIRCMFPDVSPRLRNQAASLLIWSSVVTECCGEREPALKEVLTHPAIAIVADPGGGKSVVGRAAVQQLVADGERVPVFGEIKQYRVDLSTLFRITTPAAVLEVTAHVDGVPLKRTYVLDGIDEIPRELLQRLGGELRDFIRREPQAHFVCTARQAFYVANRSLLPSIAAVFHILPLADEDVEHYCTLARYLTLTGLWMPSTRWVQAKKSVIHSSYP